MREERILFFFYLTNCLSQSYQVMVEERDEMAFELEEEEGGAPIALGPAASLPLQAPRALTPSPPPPPAAEEEG
jgi:hypothetical protein